MLLGPVVGNPDRDRSFQNIPDQREDAQRLAGRSIDIGGADILASCMPWIGLGKEPCEKKAGWYGAQEITEKGNKNSDGHRKTSRQ